MADITDSQDVDVLQIPVLKREFQKFAVYNFLSMPGTKPYCF